MRRPGTSSVIVTVSFCLPNWCASVVNVVPTCTAPGEDCEIFSPWLDQSGCFVRSATYSNTRSADAAVVTFFSSRITQPPSVCASAVEAGRRVKTSGRRAGGAPSPDTGGLGDREANVEGHELFRGGRRALSQGREERRDPGLAERA